MEHEPKRVSNCDDQNLTTDKLYLEQVDQEIREDCSKAEAECTDDLVRLHEILDEIEKLEEVGSISPDPYKWASDGRPRWRFWDPGAYIAGLSKDDISHILWGSTVSRLGVSRDELRELAGRALKHELNIRQLNTTNTDVI